LVATAINASGHAARLLQISDYLARKGFKIYLITGLDYKASLEKMGAEFIENP
jgi:UDP:flavonoid glycosyltransferase YjiC (YdhE family)